MKVTSNYIFKIKVGEWEKCNILPPETHAVPLIFHHFQVHLKFYFNSAAVIIFYIALIRNILTVFISHKQTNKPIS